MADRPALDVVVLDAGGTLIRLDYEWMARRLADLGVATDAERLRRAEIAGRRAYDSSFGQPLAAGAPAPPLGSRGDSHAYFRGLLEAVGTPAQQMDRALAGLLARQADSGLWSHAAEGAREALDALVAMRLRPCVVSNSDGRAEQTLIDCGMRRGLEFVVDSQVEGVEKPDPQLFRIALDRLGAEAGRALYVGDIRSVDEVGSRAAGMHFVLLDPFGDYAPAGSPSLSSIRELPAWVAARFEISAVPPSEPSTPPAPGRARRSREEP